jgi:hypothetical protein
MDLLSSTFVGAEAFDRAQGMVTDAQGNIYIHMNTTSKNLPTTPGVIGPTASGDQDAYLAKYSPDGKQLLWATYLGARGEDRGYGVQVGPDGSVYTVGITKSKQFPTTGNAAARYYQGGSSDFFAAKFSPDGQLIYSTFIGGSEEDWSRGNFVIDQNGAAYIGGHTQSPNFPTTPNAVQKDYRGGWDGFLVKLSPDGSQIEYSTYFGGSGNDATYSGVQVSPIDGSIYMAGMTNSPDFPVTSNAYQTTYGGGVGQIDLGDGFVVKLSPDADEVLFSTLLGGPGNDGIAKNDGLKLDAEGRAVVIGQGGEGFPVTPGASQSTYGGGLTDGFVSVLSADGSQLLNSTLLGGDQWEEPSGIDIDSRGNIYLSGNTGSSDFPTTANAYQRQYGGGQTDMMLTVLTPNLRDVLYSSLLGGSGQQGFGDRGRSLVILDDNTLLLSGDTNSADFPLQNPIQPDFGGVADGALLRWLFRRPGDANGDGLFDSTDLIEVFALGQYEDSIVGNSTWESGDWDFDGEFTTGDLVTALQLNQYESDAAAIGVVPEPSSVLLAALALAALVARSVRA